MGFSFYKRYFREEKDFLKYIDEEITIYPDTNDILALVRLQWSQALISLYHG